MNPEQKLIAAAQRAARRLSRAEGIPYQTSLDQIARSVGRRHWQDFSRAPVAIDDASRAAASEPDFSQVAQELHLQSAMTYGTGIGAVALMAGPADMSGTPSLAYRVPSNPSPYPIDARGMSLDAMATALAHATGPDGTGSIAAPNGMPLPFETRSVKTGNGALPRISLSLDGSQPPAIDDQVAVVSGAGETAMAVELPQAHPSDRPTAHHDEVTTPASEIPTDADADVTVTVSADAQTAPRIDDGLPDLYAIPASVDASYPEEILDRLIDLVCDNPGTHVRLTPRGERCDIHLVQGGMQRLIHHGSREVCSHVEYDSKERAGLDRMESRIHVAGTIVGGRDQGGRSVHVQYEANSGFQQIVRIGTSAFPPPTYVRDTGTLKAPENVGILLGREGLLRRRMRANAKSSILVAGTTGTGKTRNVLIPAIEDDRNVDVVVTDRTGHLASRIPVRASVSQVLTMGPHVSYDGLAANASSTEFRQVSRFLSEAIFPAHGRMQDARYDPRPEKPQPEKPYVRFNPLHPAMMPDGHLAAAESMSDILFPKLGVASGEWHYRASRIFVGLVDLAVRAPDLVTPPGGQPETASLLDVAYAVALLRGDTLSGANAMKRMVEAGADHAVDVCRDVQNLPGDIRMRVLDVIETRLGFLTDGHVARWMSPTIRDEGDSMARALAPGTRPATLVVNINNGVADSDVLTALVVDAAMRIRGEQGWSSRPMHVYLDDFENVSPRRSTEHLLKRSRQVSCFVSVMVTTRSVNDIQRLSWPPIRGERVRFDHAVVVGYCNDGESDWLRNEFLGVRAEAHMPYRIGDGLRLHIWENGTEMLRD